MQLQTIDIEGKTYALIQDGKPLYKGDDGKEIAFDAVGTRDTITRLNGEAKNHRERAEKAETSLKTFEGIDVDAARDAIEKLSKIDAKKLVEAGDMDAAVAAAVKPYADKLAASDKTNADLNGALNRLQIGNRFGSSKYAADRLTPAGVDLVKTLYSDRLKVEGDTVYGVDANGAKLLSKARPGEVADFDEIIETFVDAYPHKEHILKSTGAAGSGAQGGQGGGGSKTIKQAEFEALDPKARAAKMAEGYTISA